MTDAAMSPPCEPPAMPEARTNGARLLVASGARAAEDLLFELLEPLVAAAREDVFLLAKPVRIVVSSRSLRDHVSAQILRRLGAAVAGVEVQTLQRVAREVVERSHEPARPGEALIPMLVRAAARREPLLARDLGALEDGFGAVLGSVRDLIDAGRLAEAGEAIDEALAGLPFGAASLGRARALVRVGVAVSAELEALGIDSRASLLSRAYEALRRAPARALPQRAVLVHGFADATGVATDLIEALVRECGAIVLLDRPPDPADPTRPDLGCAFSERFTARIASAAGGVDDAPRGTTPGEIHLLEAAGIAAEVRGVAQRIRSLLDGGVVPERIGVVARGLGAHGARIRDDFVRLGIPFSALAVASAPDGAGRRVDAIVAMLERGGDTAIDRWLTALDSRCVTDALLSDVRLALHALGVSRLSAAATFDVDQRLGGKSSYALPVRHGLSLVEDEDGELRPRADRRHVCARALRAIAERAASACARLTAWPDAATLAEHIAHAEALLAQSLGLREDDPDAAPLFAVLAQLGDELPMRVTMDAAGFRLLLRDALAPLRTRPLGGAGAGVQVLDATQARARTFEHLFVIGLCRDVFPRIVTEDPLLPDALRRRLVAGGTGVLPDLPLKLGGLDEERYLFAQLVSASPIVSLSWPIVDDDGTDRAPSTLVERLRLEGRAAKIETLPALWSRAAASGPRPAAEHLVLAGLHAGRAAVETVMPIAVAEVMACGAAAATRDVATDAPRAEAVARSRLTALGLLDPRGEARNRLGPGLGFVGERGDGDLREAGVAVTTLERMARCPWQAFLSRVLHVEPAPDALAELPAVDALRLGRALHATIEVIVEGDRSEDARSLGDAIRRGSRRVRWPSDANLRDIIQCQSQDVLAGAGIFAPGLARALAERTEPLVRRVFEQVWQPAGGEAALFGAELEGVLRLGDAGGAGHEIRFRADLAEESAQRPRLVDLKAGRPITDAKTVHTRAKHLLRAVARGTHLQAAIYARAAGGSGAYLHADPARAGEQAMFAIDAGDGAAMEVLERSVRTLFEAWDRGSFVPRLVLPEGAKDHASPCKHCEVIEACTQGDTGARYRMERWEKARDDAAGPAAAALAAARAVFVMPAAGGTGGASDEEGSP